MPARQDQTLQIFLIIFIFLFLVSAVLAYLGWRGYSEANQRATGLQTTLTQNEQQLQTNRTIIEEHQTRMGFGLSDNPDSVKTAFEADMKAFANGVENPSYRKALETVFTDAQNTAAREATLKDDVAALKKDMQALQDQKAKEIAQIEAARQKAEAQFAAAKNSFTEDREKMKRNETELMGKVEAQKNDFEAKAAVWVKEKGAFEKEVKKLADANEILQSQRKDEPGSFEFADGRISWVNQDGTVWINLGSADSLRRQVTFSVYDHDQHDAVKAEKKGTIEVTRIMGPHMAEAKITEDDSKNPILTGDNIYSQVWHRGKRLHFALTGFIDVDGDGRSDMQLARELIEMNDGIVDAYLKEDGTVEGEMTANTRYLVLGENSESPGSARLQKGWNDMSQEAAQLGVESVTLPEFLGQMGYKPQDRTVPLGAGASARDFPARPEDQSAPVSAPRFRARKPYRAPALPPQ
jgi:hypothetical protein